MTLNDYLRSLKPHGIREADFAKLVGCTQGHVNKLRHGEVAPSWPLILRIKGATGGKVQPEDWERAQRPETAA